MNTLNLAAVVAACAALALPPTQAAAQAAAPATAKPVSLGIKFSGTPDGAEVMEMLPDRTGAAISFKVGDILIEVGGKPVSQEVLLDYLKQSKEGDQVSFKVKRGDAVVELTGKGMGVPDGAPAWAPPPSPQS
jgi:S1-C subfamily serine protease